MSGASCDRVEPSVGYPVGRRSAHYDPSQRLAISGPKICVNLDALPGIAPAAQRLKIALIVRAAEFHGVDVVNLEVCPVQPDTAIHAAIALLATDAAPLFLGEPDAPGARRRPFTLAPSEDDLMGQVDCSQRPSGD